MPKRNRKQKLQKSEAHERERASRGMFGQDAEVVAGPDEGGWGQQRLQPQESKYGYATADQSEELGRRNLEQRNMGKQATKRSTRAGVTFNSYGPANYGEAQQPASLCKAWHAQRTSRFGRSSRSTESNCRKTPQQESSLATEESRLPSDRLQFVLSE